jgi:2,3,4,5-tetrahydropyridine-2-carboxylate N-succinyltransferase
MSLQQTIENIWDNRDLLQKEESKTLLRQNYNI